jgi:geranylgeranyl diphosphate synthase, type I
VTLDEQLVDRVEAELASYLAVRRADSEAVEPEFAEALAEFVLAGGKRVRPTFAWWGWRGAGGDPEGELAERVMRAASALELVQASALAHDDLIDASATRRGRPTLHVRFTSRHRRAGWRGEPERYGMAVAVLLGDLALAWADDMLAAADLPEPALRRARPVWAAMRTEMLGGQLRDLAGQVGGRDNPEAMLAAARRVNRFKTAAYTVERPLQLGAALAGAPEHLVAAFRRFGAEIGVAFQLRDDLLGVFGDPTLTGKPAGDDLREGKSTELLALALRQASQTQDRAALAVLTTSLGDPTLDDVGVDRVREVLYQLGIPACIERRIAELTDSALRALGGVEIAEPAATRLPALAHVATRRHA